MYSIKLHTIVFKSPAVLVDLQCPQQLHSPPCKTILKRPSLMSEIKSRRSIVIIWSIPFCQGISDKSEFGKHMTTTGICRSSRRAWGFGPRGKQMDTWNPRLPASKDQGQQWTPFQLTSRIPRTTRTMYYLTCPSFNVVGWIPLHTGHFWSIDYQEKKYCDWRLRDTGCWGCPCWWIETYVLILCQEVWRWLDLRFLNIFSFVLILYLTSGITKKLCT